MAAPSLKELRDFIGSNVDHAELQRKRDAVCHLSIVSFFFLSLTQLNHPSSIDRVSALDKTILYKIEITQNKLIMKIK
jgi:hypothetical protein